ncbi:MAG TPA: DUF5675 family protein [Terriglobales bacterium]|jgi:hypothetical protein|nr:DUF5675 family protein [Terriglobales bacterium]
MLLELDLYRKWETARSVCGELWLGGDLWLYTLEPARENPVLPGHPCIPAARYRVVRTMSPRLKYICPEVLDVPGRSHIRWHIGNRPEDVEGCAAVGEFHGLDWVGNSHGAFNRLMAVLRGYTETWVTYHDGPPFEEKEKDGQRETELASGQTAPGSSTYAGVRPGDPGAGDIWLRTK